LAVSLSGVIPFVDDKVLWSIVLTASEIAVEDRLDAVSVTDLGIDRGARHVRNHGVAAAPWALDIAEWVVLGGGLREPNVTTISAKLTALDGFSDIFLDNDGTTGSVDEPSALLHLGDEILVEQSASLLVKRAVDGDNVTLSKHLLKGFDTTAANLLLNLGLEGLVVEVKQFLAVEGLETAQYTLTNTANGDGTDDLVLQVVLVLSDSSNVPFTIANLLVGRDEVANQGENGHDHVLSDRDDIAASDFGHGDTAIGLVSSVQIHVVRANTSGDSDL
jgi:hypothetical protein